MKRDAANLGWLAVAMLAGLSAGGCHGADAKSDGRPGYPLAVVCTTGQIADMLENIGGSHLTVQSLMGPGVDPHLYKATPGDVRKLNAADVVFYSGLHLEGRLASLLEKLATRKPVHAVTEGIHQDQHDSLRKVPGSDDQYDPHVWFNVSLWAECVDYAAEKLVALDPDHADDYRHNLAGYLSRLSALHESCKERMAEIPTKRRVMVTAHDAFGYFGDAYDVEVHGLQGISTADEVDLVTADALVELLVSRRIKAVFVESSVPARHLRSMIGACDVRGHRVVVGGELFSDAMGSAGTLEGTYIGMVEYNVNTIVEALK